MPAKRRSQATQAGSVAFSDKESSQNCPEVKPETVKTVRTVAQRLKLLVDTSSKKNVHEAAGVSEKTLGRWLDGKGEPSFTEGKAIARATGCSPAWLLTGEGQPFPPQRPESAEGQAALAAIAGRAVSMAVDGMRQLQAALPLLDAMPDLAAFDQAREDLDAALRDRTDKTRKVEVSEPPDMTTRKNSGQRKGPPAGDAAPEKGT